MQGNKKIVTDATDDAAGLKSFSWAVCLRKSFHEAFA
jgi:hypothetical protein